MDGTQQPSACPKEVPVQNEVADFLHGCQIERRLAPLACYACCLGAPSVAGRYDAVETYAGASLGSVAAKAVHRRRLDVAHVLFG
jgi:hypothetical protein